MPKKEETADLFAVDPITKAILGAMIKEMSLEETNVFAQILSERGGRSYEDSQEIIRLFKEGKEEEAGILLEESTNLTGEQRKHNYDTGTKANVSARNEQNKTEERKKEVVEIDDEWQEVESSEQITKKMKYLSLSPSAGKEDKKPKSRREEERKKANTERKLKKGFLLNRKGGIF